MARARLGFAGIFAIVRPHAPKLAQGPGQHTSGALTAAASRVAGDLIGHPSQREVLAATSRLTVLDRTPGGVVAFTSAGA